MNSAIRGEYSVGSWMTPVVRRLLWANAILYLLKFLTGRWISWHPLALTPEMALHHGMVWQFFTYMYIHFDLMHVLFNLFGLFMFGRDVEQIFGGTRFFAYYTLCGLGAALVSCAAYPTGTILGASGAIYGVLLAFAVLFPYRPVYFLFVPVPIPAKWFIVVYGLIDLIYGMESGGSVAYMAHLGGLATGLLYFWFSGQLKFPFGARRQPASQPSFLGRLLARIRQSRDLRRSEEQRLSAAALDAILDKIAKSGMNGLTREERRRLKNASTELRKTGK